MKLSYNNKVSEDRKVMAEVFHMEGDKSEVCLNIYHSDPSKVTTIYYDGDTVVQVPFSIGKCSIKKFYKGDSVTITF